MSNSPRITLRDVARVCNVSVATASLSLRDAASIPLATRNRVKSEAHKLGYLANRAMARVMSEIRSTPTKAYRETLGYLFDHRIGPGLNWPQRLETGMRQRAAELGYSLDRFEINDPGLSAARLSSLLKARGIRGLILSPMAAPNSRVDLEWEHFAGVAIGYSISYPELSRVARDLFHQMRAVYTELHHRGYRRVGMVGTASYEVILDQVAIASNLLQQWEQSPENRVTPLVMEELTRSALEQWIAREKPDVIVTMRRFIRTWLIELGLRLPEDIGFLSTSAEPGYPETGLHPNHERLGAVAVEQVTSLIEHDSFGIPQEPVTTLVRGLWCEAGTIRLPPVLQPLSVQPQGVL